VPRQIALGPDVTSPAEARLFVTHWTRTWGYRSLISAAALLTSELATNAVVHAASPFWVDVANTGHGIHVTVRDPSPAEVTMREPSQIEEHGRGLRVVDAVSSAWGTEPVGGAGNGKAVWFELDVRKVESHLG
jgi:anti-sigma regulatory factor (Ser/Thr protein kinase)